MASAYMEAMTRLQVILRESDEEEIDEETILSNDNMACYDGCSDSVIDCECCSDLDTDVKEYDEEDSQSSESSGVYIGKDKSTVWMKQKLKSEINDEAFTSAIGIPGPVGEAANVADPVSSWKVLFDDAIIDKIVERTNANIEKRMANFMRERDCRKTDSREIYAIIGLLYLSGLFKSSHVNVKELWSSDGTGMSIFHTTMSRSRFYLLLRFMTFDDLNTREEREKTDNLAQIRELFQMFISKCQYSYSIGKYINIDYIMVPYRGKCLFRHYVPGKAAKNGIKVFSLVDSGTLYTWNMEIYNCKQLKGPYKVSVKPENIIKRLASPLFKAGRRNLTVDSWFTTYPLAKDLLAQDITLVGAIKQSEPEVPFRFKSSVSNKRNACSSVFGFRDDSTMVSYCSERGKCTVYLSTLHKDDAIDKCNGKNTPEIVTFFNSTKEAVGRVEKMITCYSTSRITNRWPLVVFFSLLNIAAVNARIILMSTKEPPMKYKSRREYLKDLGLSLVSDHIKFRSSLDNMPRILRVQCASFSGGSEEPPPAKKLKVVKNARCSFCPRAKDRKTNNMCFYCMRLACHEHSRRVCQTCAEDVLP